MRYGGVLHGFSFGMGFELMRRVIVPAILVATPLVLWWWLGPEKPSCDSARTTAARTAIARAADQIRQERGDLHRAAVLHLTNDSTDFVTRELREQLMNGGLLDLDGTPPTEKFRNLFNLRNPGVFSVEAAIAYGRSRKLDAVITGEIRRFETVKGKAVLDGRILFVRMADGAVSEIPLTTTAAGGVLGEIAEKLEADRKGESSAPLSLMTRLILMTLAILGLPILVFPFLKSVMSRNSNASTALALVLLLIADGFIISLALGTSGTFCGLAVFLIALAASFGYDLFMMSYAQLCRPSLPTV